MAKLAEFHVHWISIFACEHLRDLEVRLGDPARARVAQPTSGAEQSLHWGRFAQKRVAAFLIGQLVRGRSRRVCGNADATRVRMGDRELEADVPDLHRHWNARWTP